MKFDSTINNCTANLRNNILQSKRQNGIRSTFEKNIIFIYLFKLNLFIMLYLNQKKLHI